MQRRDEVAQMPPQKIKRHFDGEKLMPLVRLPRRAQRLFPAPVKSGGQRRERGFAAVESDPPVAFEIQADFDAAGMKAFAPIEFLARLEVVPLETHARAAHAAVQMPPAVANRAPRRTFGEHGRDADFGFPAHFGEPSGNRRHGQQCAMFFRTWQYLVVNSAKNVRRKAPLINSKPATAGFSGTGYFRRHEEHFDHQLLVCGRSGIRSHRGHGGRTGRTVAAAHNHPPQPHRPARAMVFSTGWIIAANMARTYFPEPFLVDDSDLETDEARLDWLHTGGNGQHSDTVTAEVEKGFGLLTLELEVPYERDTASGQTSQGFGNIDLGARYPVYQFVSGNGFVDSTLGAALEVGIPVNSVGQQKHRARSQNL